MTPRRPISIASATSVTLHVVILLALGLFYARAQLSETDTLPVLSLNLVTAEPGSVEAPEGLTTPQTDTPQEVVEEQQPIEQPTATEPDARADETLQAHRSHDPANTTEPAKIPTEPDRAQAMASALSSHGVAPSDQPQTSDILVVERPVSAGDTEIARDTSGSEVVLTTRNTSALELATATAGAPGSALPREPLDVRQRKMINRRLEQWGDRIERLAAEQSVEWKHRGERYTARFEPRPARDNTGFDEVVITISSRQDGRRLATEMVLRRLAFSHFGQFVHRWDPRVQIHDDVIDGRFHANSDVLLSYTRKVVPQFNGRVTIAGRSIRIHEKRGFVSRDEMFRAGLETGVRRISLPQRFVPFPGAAPDSPALVHAFDEDSRIVFAVDGSYAHAPLNAVGGRTRRALAQPTQYLLANGNARLHVSGTVNGRVLVYSPERIVIEGDLRYANDPSRDKKSDDYLGLVSDRSVEVAAARITGPGDLRIDAAVYARRNFSVRDFRSGDTALLHLYGSLTAGSLDATEPRYRTRIEFDDRLEHVRPPAFPVTGRYELVAWDGDWVVAE